VFSEPHSLSPGSDFPEEIMKLVGSLMPLRPARVYEFSTADANWKLTLSKDFIALVCLKYEKWEHFLEHLRTPLQALIQEYSPAFFSRVGLRYRNVIKKSELGLRDTPWSELLKVHIAAELATPIAGDIEAANHQVLVRLQGKEGKVTINHGLALPPHASEESYVIDNDFFTEERIEVKNAELKLDYFHGQSGHLFQWCIDEKLHTAMRPKPVR
jgi:uncharacterized protein (TIGR04255 family)